MTKIKKIFLFLFLLVFKILSAETVLENKSDEILTKIREYDFYKSQNLINQLKDKDILEEEKNQKNTIINELVYYQNIISEFGFYKKNPLSPPKYKKQSNSYIESLQLLNVGLYSLLYEYSNDEIAYKKLLLSLECAKKSRSNVLICEVLKSILIYFRHLVNIENTEFLNFCNEHKKYSYDKLEQDIQKVLEFYLKLEVKNCNYSQNDVLEMINISKKIDNSYYRRLATKNLAIYYEVRSKDIINAERFYKLTLLNSKINYGADQYIFETTQSSYLYFLKQQKKFIEAINLSQNNNKILSHGKISLWNSIFKYSAISDAYAGLNRYDSAYFYKEKSRIIKNEFEQNEHNAKINELNSERKDVVIKTQEKELGKLTKTMIVLGVLIFLFLVYFTYSKRIEILRKKIDKAREEKTKTEHQNQLLQKELERQKELEKERERISSDMHDDIGARISALKLQGEFIKENYSENPHLKSELDELMKTTEEMTVAMREMIWSLKTQNDFLQNFISFSQKYASEFFLKSKIKIHFKNEVKENLHLNAEVRRNLFLCYKEALNNIYKHSKATDVYISFSLENNLLKLEISDNGIGINKEQTKQGNGMYNMKTRMQEISGNLKIPETEKGTLLLFTSPLEL